MNSCRDFNAFLTWWENSCSISRRSTLQIPLILIKEIYLFGGFPFFKVFLGLEADADQVGFLNVFSFSVFKQKMMEGVRDSFREGDDVCWFW